MSKPHVSVFQLPTYLTNAKTPKAMLLGSAFCGLVHSYFELFDPDKAAYSYFSEYLKTYRTYDAIEYIENDELLVMWSSD